MKSYVLRARICSQIVLALRGRFSPQQQPMYSQQSFCRSVGTVSVNYISCAGAHTICYAAARRRRQYLLSPTTFMLRCSFLLSLNVSWLIAGIELSHLPYVTRLPLLLSLLLMRFSPTIFEDSSLMPPPPKNKA